MGWIFRKSLNFGPFRINLSKSGVGGSFGIGPFRVGRSASGRGYASTRIPGTGISYRTSSGGNGRGRGAGAASGSGETGGKTGRALAWGFLLVVVGLLVAVAIGVLLVAAWLGGGSTQ
jgi:hypothetical protein